MLIFLSNFCWKNHDSSFMKNNKRHGVSVYLLWSLLLTSIYAEYVFHLNINAPNPIANFIN